MTNEPLAVTALVQVASTLQRANGRLADLAHVTDLISSYLDTTISLTPPQAVRRGSHRLFQRVVTRVTIDPSVDPVFRAHWLARALEAAIEKDDLVLVQQIHKWHPTPLNAKSLKYAFKFGSLQLVLWIIHNRHDRRCCEPGLKNLCRACLLAALPASSFQGPDAGSVIEWLLCQGVDLVHLSGAARNLSTLSWLDAHDHLESLDPSSQLAKMIREGYDRHVDVVRYLIDHGASLSEERLIISLIRSSCQRKAEPMVDVVVASQLCDSLRDKFVWAPTRPDGVKVLQWDATFMAEKTLQGSVPMSHTITYFASKFCHVDTLAWLVEERGVRLTSSSNRKPRREKDLLSLYQWMLDTGVRDFRGWRLGDAYCSARKGYIRTVQWLHEHKPALFYPHTMDTAAENGHLSIVQWLHENRNEGCTPNALVLAAKNGHLDIVQWLSANKTEGSTNDAMVAAAVGGHLEVLAWLHANRADSCNACVLTAVLRHDKCANKTMDPIRWLTAHNSRAGSCIGHCVQDPLRRTAAFSVAATLMKRGDVNSARYLLEHHRDAFKIESLERMTRGSHLPALKWLYAAAPDLVDWQHALQVAGESETHEIAEWLELMQNGICACPSRVHAPTRRCASGESYHVTDLISSYLDTTIYFTPKQAVRRGSHRLYEHVLTRVMIDPTLDTAFRVHWLAHTLETAIQKNNLLLVQQIHKQHPAPLNAKSLNYALKYGSLELVHWVVENRHDCRCYAPGLKNLCHACLVAALPSPSFQGPDATSVMEWILRARVDRSELPGAVRNLNTLSWLSERGHLESLDVSNELGKIISNGYARHMASYAS